MAFPQEYLGGNISVPDDLKSFYFLRHGSTDLNVKREVDGRPMWYAQGAGTNVVLNKMGEQQARLAGNVLRTLGIKRVVCSPLLRAIQTAILANVAPSEFVTEDKLKERDFGKNEGELAPRELFFGDCDDCELTEAFSARVAKGLEHVRSEGTLLVSHGGVLRTIAALLRAEMLNEHVDNGVVVHFQRDGSSWKVTASQSPVVLVSGANRGIGLAIAKELISHGYRVSLGARDVGKLEEIFGAQNEYVQHALFDAFAPSTCKDWVSAAVTKFGRIDALVNNAGQGGPVKLMDDNEKALDRLWTVNTKAPLRLTQLCLPHLEATGAGRIVNINSLSGLRVKDSHNLGYIASKFAQMGLSETTRCYSWPSGVRTTAICPGWVSTDMSAHTDKIKRQDMILPETIAQIARLAIELPNNASIATIPVNCELEALY
jgi:NAD(P)-dependent dehydrogenase (short-subunit alcohol dehydrogenase family)/broad specificity phosphatase PhoE